MGLSLEGLTQAMLRILARKPEEPPENNHYAPRGIHRDEHTVEQCMLGILRMVKVGNGRITFEEVFSETPTREEVVTQFMALLELLKLGEIHAEQEDACGEIILLAGRRPDPEEEGFA